MRKILVIDDDANIRDIVAKAMKYEGYSCTEAGDGLAGLDCARAGGHDLILLDLMLPRMDGITVLKKLRGAGLLTPVIIMTARSDEVDKIVGLALGADDYITKPFSVRELAARVEAVLRRYERAADGEAPIIIGDIRIDVPRHEVSLAGAPVDLSLKEFELLRALAENRGRVFTREQLLESVWGYDYTGETRTVDVHVRYLRRKLGDAAVLTIRGLGYKIP
jgi:DNA-binding response OmpR family regulator